MKKTRGLISIVIPARDQAPTIASLIQAVRGQCPAKAELEIIVVDDMSKDDTCLVAKAAGATSFRIPAADGGGNPAVARNRGAAVASGDPIVFLDADCIPKDGWLLALLQAHDRGASVVGGSLDMPPDLPWMARVDYFGGWYHVHSRRRPGFVPNHPPANLSVRRSAFEQTRGFTDRHPIAYAHEELVWQGKLRRLGHRIYFEPAAAVFHENRPGFGNLLRRNYRWGYSAIESKFETGAARLAWLYRYPRVIIALSIPSAPVQAAYIVGCWVRSRVFAPVLFAPIILSARFAYSVGVCVGGLRWLSQASEELGEARPRWE